MKIPADLKPEQVVALVDSREQTPLNLSPLQMVTSTLHTGDYSLRGLERHVAIERKSLPDLIACVGTERPRFDREVKRLLAFQTRALVIESDWPEIEAGEWRGKVTPAAAIGSLLGWAADGLPLVMCGSHERAGVYVGRMLFITARRHWRELRMLAGAVDCNLALPKATDAQEGACP